MIRIGHGFDVHRLVAERPLVLGGVTIPHAFGLLGHSDADVLLHAISDAVLGALGLGDIGQHFPDTDPAYQGVSSMLLLEHVFDLARKRGFRVGNLDHVFDLARKRGFRVGNLDATIVAERPKLAPFIAEMTANIARTCQVPGECVNVKATTTEGLGFTGRGEGIAAHAVVLMTDDEQ
jgi:2-C-methyl-D-erythritol 2,4-cyclodiphosphate synthase